MAGEPLLYREEVLTIMGVIGDIRVDVGRILDLLEEDGDEEEEEEH